MGGALSEAEADEVLRIPCYHVFHRQCVMEYCQSELLRDHSEEKQTDVGSRRLHCPECRADIPWTDYPELQGVLAQSGVEDSEFGSNEKDLHEDAHVRQAEVQTWVENSKHARSNKQSAEPVPGVTSSRHEAFIRLHHLYQGNDPKEKPLLRLLKELGLDAVVYYGKPALLHIQGDPKDVDSFSGTAKRRHITVTIDMAQRSQGPPITSGITSVAAKKGSLDSSLLAGHLNKRGLGETSYTIIG